MLKYMNTNYNDKYSIKILKFIHNNLKKVGDLIDGSINNLDSKFLNDISNLVSSTYKENYHFELKTYQLFQIHEVDQYPLMYLFLCKMYEYGMLDELSDQIDINNFNKFVEWYRKNHTYINFDLMHDNINKISDKDHELSQLYHLIYKTEGNRSDLHNLLYNNKFISLDVQHHAESTNILKSVYWDEDFKLTVYSPNIKFISSSDINKVIHIIKFMNELGKLNGSQNTPDVSIFAGLQRKQFCSDSNNEHILCPENINSGLSIRGKYVKIWRLEEVYKVLIHELIHFHKLDFHTYSNNYKFLSQFITNTYNINGIDSSNESYTETLAVLIHSALISFYYKYSINDVLKDEITFTLFQVSKILNYFGMSTSQELGYKPINQTTSVFSYYVIKGSLLISLPIFLNFICDNIRNLSIENRILEFLDLVKNCMNELYFELIDKTMQSVNSIDNIDKNKFVMRTLRMTCFQM